MINGIRQSAITTGIISRKMNLDDLDLEIAKIRFLKENSWFEPVLYNYLTTDNKMKEIIKEYRLENSFPEVNKFRNLIKQLIQCIEESFDSRKKFNKFSNYNITHLKNYSCLSINTVKLLDRHRIYTKKDLEELTFREFCNLSAMTITAIREISFICEFKTEQIDK